MKLIPNAKQVAKKSLSLWVNRSAFALMILPEVLYALTGIDTNPALLFWAGAALYVAVEISRLIDQGIGDRASSPALVMIVALAMSAAPVPPPAFAGPVSEAEFLQEAVPLTSSWEGKRNTAYLDKIASPPRWTVCYGETRGVKQGDYYTDAECAAMLADGLVEYRNALHRAFTPETLQNRLTPKRDAAYVDLAWNAGVYAISRSTAVRRLNAGNIRGGCYAIGWWDKAGNRRIRGLVLRRKVNVAYCLHGLDAAELAA